MKNNYMDNIYDVLETPVEEVYDDGIEYLDSPEEEYFYDYDDSLAWADDITYLDEPEEELDLDLGEGFIPLYQGDNYQEELVVIDENYVLDEFEEDLLEKPLKPSIYEEKPNKNKKHDEYSMDEIYNIIYDDPIEEFNFENAESLIKFPEQQNVLEELNIPDMNEEDDKLAKAIAKEHMENVKLGETAGGLYGDIETPEDDTSWVDNTDPFGNDINVIIAEDPNKEVIEDDFVEGSFQDWLDQQNS